eukprot:6213720-Pleurochrysis_carterae.AAC.1
MSSCSSLDAPVAQDCRMSAAHFSAGQQQPQQQQQTQQQQQCFPQQVGSLPMGGGTMFNPMHMAQQQQQQAHLHAQPFTMQQVDIAHAALVPSLHVLPLGASR